MIKKKTTHLYAMDGNNHIDLKKKKSRINKVINLDHDLDCLDNRSVKQADQCDKECLIYFLSYTQCYRYYVILCPKELIEICTSPKG